MTDKSKAAFEAWYRSDEDKDLTDNAPSIDDLDAHHKYWMLAAWEASRKQTLAEPEQPARVPLTNAQIKSSAYDHGALPEVITVASLLAYSRALLEIAKSTNTSGCFGPHDEKDDNK